jgi:hypothetical protein
MRISEASSEPPYKALRTGEVSGTESIGGSATEVSVACYGSLRARITHQQCYYRKLLDYTAVTAFPMPANYCQSYAGPCKVPENYKATTDDHWIIPSVTDVLHFNTATAAIQDSVNMSRDLVLGELMASPLLVMSPNECRDAARIISLTNNVPECFVERPAEIEVSRTVSVTIPPPACLSAGTLIRNTENRGNAEDRIALALGIAESNQTTDEATATVGSSSVAKPRQESSSSSHSMAHSDPSPTGKAPGISLLDQTTLPASEHDMLVSVAGKKNPNFLGKNPEQNRFAIKSLVEPGTLPSLVQFSDVGSRMLTQAADANIQMSDAERESKLTPRGTASLQPLPEVNKLPSLNAGDAIAERNTGCVGYFQDTLVTLQAHIADQVSSGIGHSPRDYERSAREEHQWMHEYARGQISSNPLSWEPPINLNRPFIRHSGMPQFVHPREEPENHIPTSDSNGQALLPNSDTPGLTAQEATAVEIEQRLRDDENRPHFGEVVTNFRTDVDLGNVVENNGQLAPSHMMVDNVLPYWENLFRDEMDDCFGPLELHLKHFRSIQTVEMSVSEFSCLISWHTRSKPIQTFLSYMPNLIHTSRLKDDMIVWKTEAEAGDYAFQTQLGRGPVPPWSHA